MRISASDESISTFETGFFVESKRVDEEEFSTEDTGDLLVAESLFEIGDFAQAPFEVVGGPQHLGQSSVEQVGIGPAAVRAVQRHGGRQMGAPVGACAGALGGGVKPQRRVDVVSMQQYLQAESDEAVVVAPRAGQADVK
ncbi:MAG: hypothetical protein ABEL76_07545 [Bradymonadaceae bacterium]